IEHPYLGEAVPVLVVRYPCTGAVFPPSTPAMSCERPHDDQSRHIDIGLINNMPDAPLETTVRQFAVLVGSADPGAVIHLKLLSMPGVPSPDRRRPHLSTFYSDFHDLWDPHLDGLIVTG